MGYLKDYLDKLNDINEEPKETLKDFPLLAREYDVSANGMTADKVVASSVLPAHWICSKCGFHYTTSIRNRVLGHKNCPRCNNK